MCSPVRHPWAGLPAIVLILVTVPGAQAQERPPVVTPPPQPHMAAADAAYTVSRSRTAEGLRQSGLSETQSRAQSQAAGYDAKLIDPFLATQAAGGERGAVIRVPEKSEGGTNAGEGFTRIFQMAATLTSLVIARAAIH